VAATNLDEIVQRIVYLPSAPEVATKITRLAEDPRSCADDIAQVVRKDPATAGRILRLVNSSHFGLRTQVKTLRHAVSILGLKVIRSVALSVSMVGSFKKMRVPAVFSHRRFWEHSALTACLAQFIAKEHRGVDPDVAFDVGLMHDIGKLIIACYATDELNLIVKTSREEGLSFTDAEQRVMNTGHSEIGGWLAKRWNFSPELVHGITAHHDHSGANDDPMIATCQFANAICKAKGFRTVGNNEKVSVPKGVYNCLRISDSDVARIFAAADDEMERSKQMLATING